jgi:hypothetical protein
MESQHWNIASQLLPVKSICLESHCDKTARAHKPSSSSKQSPRHNRLIIAGSLAGRQVEPTFTSQPPLIDLAMAPNREPPSRGSSAPAQSPPVVIPLVPKFLSPLRFDPSGSNENGARSQQDMPFTGNRLDGTATATISPQDPEDLQVFAPGAGMSENNVLVVVFRFRAPGREVKGLQSNNPTLSQSRHRTLFLVPLRQFPAWGINLAVVCRATAHGPLRSPIIHHPVARDLVQPPQRGKGCGKLNHTRSTLPTCAKAVRCFPPSHK